MFYLIVFLCVMCVVCKQWYKKQSDLEPPELSGWLPIVGHSYMLMGDGVKKYQSIVRLTEECTEKGGLVTLYLGFTKVYVVTDPDDCVTVMNTCLEKGLIIKFAKQFLGNGLISADVQRWQTSRKLLNPAFSQKVLDGFIEIFNSQAEDLVNKFALETGTPFDHEHLLRINNLETICSTSFEAHDSECSNILRQYLPLLSTAMKKISERMQNFWLHNDFIYKMTSLNTEVNEILLKLKALSKMMIEKKKLEKQERDMKTETGKSKRFIDLILDVAEETDCFTDDQMREESDTIIAAGHDTSASTLTFALTLLGSNTDVQDKLYEEIYRVCGSSNRSLDKIDLSKLVYTDAVLKETLRLYPIGLILPRNIEKDIKLKNYTVKANHECFVAVHGLHRQNIWGPDADQFRPERWLDKKTLPDPKYYGGFGLGRRSCVGKAYAMMSMKILLAHVLRRYRVSSDINKMVVSLYLMAKPESGHFINIEQREQCVGQ